MVLLLWSVDVFVPDVTVGRIVWNFINSVYTSFLVLFLSLVLCLRLLHSVVSIGITPPLVSLFFRFGLSSCHFLSSSSESYPITPLANSISSSISPIHIFWVRFLGLGLLFQTFDCFVSRHLVSTQSSYYPLLFVGWSHVSHRFFFF